MAITNDTRVRNISDDDVKKLEKLSKIFEIKTTTGVLLNLIPEYFSNQATIKGLRKDKEKLERELIQSRAELANLKKGVKSFFDIEEQMLEQKEYLLNLK